MERKYIREREVLEVLCNIDLDLAQQVADQLGIEIPAEKKAAKLPEVQVSPRLSFEAFKPEDIKARKIALLVHDKANEASIKAVQTWAESEGAVVDVLTPNPGPVLGQQGEVIPSDGMQKAEPSIAYDAVVIADGDNYDVVMKDGVATHYLLEAYKHLKPIVFLGDKGKLIEDLRLVSDEGTLANGQFEAVQDSFKTLILNHRVWTREAIAEAIPA